jgi:hypothetical protein
MQATGDCLRILQRSLKVTSCRNGHHIVRHYPLTVSHFINFTIYRIRNSAIISHKNEDYVHVTDSSTYKLLPLPVWWSCEIAAKFTGSHLINECHIPYTLQPHIGTIAAKSDRCFVSPHKNAHAPAAMCQCLKHFCSTSF